MPLSANARTMLVRIARGRLPDVTLLLPNIELRLDVAARSGFVNLHLILFFDGITVLVPNYMSDLPGYSDPAIVAGLQQHGLFHIIEPETAVDEAATVALADAMDDIIKAGGLNDLQGTEEFEDISMSRMGFMGKGRSSFSNS